MRGDAIEALRGGGLSRRLAARALEQIPSKLNQFATTYLHNIK